MTSKETAAAEIDLEIKVEISKYAANYFLGMKENESSVVQAIMDAAYHWYQKGASLQPKEADKDREIERLKDEIQSLKDWKESACRVMPDFQEIGKLLGIGLGESVSEQIIPKIKELKDKDIQSKWISVEAVKELLAKQRVLCAEYLEDSFSEHPYKLHQMINYAPEAEQK